MSNSQSGFLWSSTFWSVSIIYFIGIFIMLFHSITQVLIGGILCLPYPSFLLTKVYG